MSNLDKNPKSHLLSGGSALRKAHSLEHIDIEARRGPASREHSLANYSGTEDLPGPAHNLKGRIAHEKNPASGGPDSRDHSTANPLGILMIVLHIVAHIELHIKVILLVEALIQGNTQQHILVVCQILQVNLKVPFLKAITHQGIQVTALQPPHQG